MTVPVAVEAQKKHVRQSGSPVSYRATGRVAGNFWCLQLLPVSYVTMTDEQQRVDGYTDG
jgi:hypothetical protein